MAINVSGVLLTSEHKACEHDELGIAGSYLLWGKYQFLFKPVMREVVSGRYIEFNAFKAWWRIHALMN